jgi:hypothetical protein
MRVRLRVGVGVGRCLMTVGADDDGRWIVNARTNA